MKDSNNPWDKEGSSRSRTVEGLFKVPDDFTNLFNQNIIISIVTVLILIWIASGIYIVQEGEQAAVMRFGKFIGIAKAGPNYHIPYPIENIIKVSVDRIQREEIGFRSDPSTRYTITDPKLLNEESLMLTGDENIADINFFVQWRVSNIGDYLYKVDNIRDTVKSAAESAMREIIGNSTIAAVQTEGRAKVEMDAQNLLQKTLDNYKAGIVIENLHLLKVDPPAEVIDAFRDVQTARADKERKINQAEAYRNDILPRARGEASKIFQDAEGYRSMVIAKARGEAEQFMKIYAQYAKAKDVTKKRMYLDTMEQILTGTNKVIISSNLNKSMVPYLSLNNLTKN